MYPLPSRSRDMPYPRPSDRRANFPTNNDWNASTAYDYYSDSYRRRPDSYRTPGNWNQQLPPPTWSSIPASMNSPFLSSPDVYYDLPYTTGYYPPEESPLPSYASGSAFRRTHPSYASRFDEPEYPSNLYDFNDLNHTFRGLEALPPTLGTAVMRCGTTASSRTTCSG